MAAEFSLLVPTYSGDDPSKLARALSSVWDRQTLRPTEIVLVVDGPVPSEHNHMISASRERIGAILEVVRLPENRGLALALNEGLAKCRCDLVARLDADDTALPERFARQLSFLEENPDVAVLGTWAEEVDEESGQTTLRQVPDRHDDIVRFAKRRNPINHPSVMFRKDAVLAVGGYPSYRRWQDYALWVLMLEEGYKFANLPEVLVRMSGGEALMRRRGLDYFSYEARVLWFQWRIGFLSTLQLASNMLIRFVARGAPVSIRKWLYERGRTRLQ